MEHFDVIIMGGAIMGSATAYALLQERPALKVLIIERDPTYRRAATPLALGGVRQQFSERVNIRMARQSIETFEHFGELMETRAYGRPEIDFRQGGYLFLVSEEKWATAMENARVQIDEGVELKILSVDELRELLPDVDLTGVAGGTVCPREGLLDPQAVLGGYTAKVAEMGAVYRTDEVTGLVRDGDRILACTCASGKSFSADYFVNATGPWCREIMHMCARDLPVEPLRHDIYVTRIDKQADIGLAYTTLPDTCWWFREHADGDTMLCGKTKLDFELGFDYSPDLPYFADVVWPSLAANSPSLDRVRLLGAWRGCYEFNTVDQNAIIGFDPEIQNLLLINGFSGHGMMQAPAAGRGVAELILHGAYQTLDLSELSAKRFETGALVVEKAII